MRTRLPRLCLAVLLLAAAGGCTKPTGSVSAGGPVTTCTKAEQQCQYAEGKIGLCTASGMDCDGSSSCLVCMSLH